MALHEGIPEKRICPVVAQSLLKYASSSPWVDQWVPASADAAHGPLASGQARWLAKETRPGAPRLS